MIGRDAAPADGPMLAAMARTSFTETFAALYDPADLAAFLDAAFGPAGLPAQIGDPAYRIRLAVEGDAIIGYAKIGPVVFPGDWPPRAIELHQLYVLAGHHGSGVGPALMDWAIDAAREGGASDMLLSVWTGNARARAFYARHGFAEVGTYVFMVGTQADEDLVLRLAL